MVVGRVCCSMKSKYEINFCFIKYQYNVHHSIAQQFETMGFTKLSTHNDQEHKNWFGCNRSLCLAGKVRWVKVRFGLARSGEVWQVRYGG